MADSKKYNGSSWVHSLRKLTTATDTITTLPAVIHPTGTTATVGLKGNTLQSSIPSPTSPIMPQGCGDLETSGAKAGQYKIPISSANTTTPVYLGAVETTRKIKKLVLTGEEDWKPWSSGQPDIERYYYKWGKTTPYDYGLICTHLPFIKEDGNYEHIRLGGSNREDFIIFISRTIAPIVTDFKSYLAQQYAAGTPVCVWYVLATEETGIVNEPLRKIGDYADTVSGISIPTITGKDTFDVETTLKPSEVSLSYTGWHDATVEEWDGSDWK